MLLRDLIKQIDSESKVLDITADTRKVKAGSLFFLLPRAEKHFDRLFKEATDKEAALVVHGLKAHEDEGYYVENIEAFYTKSLQKFYHESYSNLKIYGLTGTNGKTSVATMIKDLLELYGEPTGLFGTVGNFFKDNLLKTDLTSPMAEDFYRFNHENFKKGMKTVVCEVSSHALDQKRLGLDFLTGSGFTSFSQDHLDYHGDMKTYLEAKGKIFSEALHANGFFIYPKSLKEFSSLKPLRNQKVLCLGGETYSYKILKTDFDGISMSFTKGDKSITGVLPLFGAYNAENFAMALVFLCEHFGGGFFPDQNVFEDFKQISGRMERFVLGGDSHAVVDFSHTPDSLEKALKTLRDLKPDHQLIVVFGCGGDRDKNKRPEMGKIASSLADKIIVTNDNPRAENPEDIAQGVLKGVEKSLSTKVSVELDRTVAVQSALSLAAQTPSLVLIAGKGHEQTQEVEGKKLFFSDQNEVLEWLKENKV